MNNLIDRIFFGSYPMLVTFLEAEDELLMRDYLLCPDKRFGIAGGKFWLIKSLNDLWPLMTDKRFIGIHLMYNEKELLSNPVLTEMVPQKIEEAVRQSELILGLICKKNTSSKRAVIRSFFPMYGEDEDDEDEKEEKKIEKTETTEKADESKKSEKKIRKSSSRVGTESEEKAKNISKSSELGGGFLSSLRSTFGTLTATTKLDGMLDKLHQAIQPYIGNFFSSNQNDENSNSNKITPEAQIQDILQNHQSSGVEDSNANVFPLSLNEATQTPPITNPESPTKSDSQGTVCTVSTKDTMDAESRLSTLETQSACSVTKMTPLQEFVHMIETLNENNPKSTIPTLSLRLELYTQQQYWRNSSKHTKNLLFTFTLAVKDKLESILIEWMRTRYSIYKSHDTKPLKKSADNILYLNLSSFVKKTEENSDDFLDLAESRSWKFDEKISSKVTEKTDMLSLNYMDELERERYFNLVKSKFTTGGVLDALGYITNSKNNKDLPIFALPFYLNASRDSFAYDLIAKRTVLKLRGRDVIKTEYFFHKDCAPHNFKSFVNEFPDYRVGVTTYDNFFSHEELQEIEERTYETEINCFRGRYFPMTGQTSFISEKVKRTKFFFGARYMWSKVQLSEPHSHVGAGVRVDVSEPPAWMRSLVEAPMVDQGIIEKDFINSITMNVYHDGKEGLAQHFDDAVRFKQPIFTLRIFSDARLSFGSQYYGFCNGAFCIPMLRGCITVMEENSYAANGIKHCVRPCDMSGKSAAIILRQMHSRVVTESKLYDFYVDFPTQFSTLSLNDDAVPYADQKKIEAEGILNKTTVPMAKNPLLCQMQTMDWHELM
eukprot:TRINITY_DN5663_c0_g1_i5.p1 TRINITY_DN5663_c0_g1~~TRINITY_DN5663_c0_g1_i5.p1  ORF type:complete len:831 (+),score=111.95 TRINITY_DN5663_c0_g1_i5:560-3052(+)